MAKTCALALLMWLFPAPAFAVPVTIEWTWPTVMCGGGQIGAIQGAELYVSEAPIGSSAEIEGDLCARPADIPPTSAVLETVNTNETSVTLDLEGGKTYFFRMRVKSNNRWSNLSAQFERLVPAELPNVPIIIRIT